MADEDEDGEGAEGEDAPPKKSKKKLIIIAAGALVLLLGGGAAAFFLLGGEDAPPQMAEGEMPAEGADPAMDPNLPPPKAAFFELPSMLVNLASEGRQATYLRVGATLELAAGADLSLAEERASVIVDGFQAFLREMRPRDLSGSGGLMRLKEELLVRANAALETDVVQNVLLTELLVQ